MIFSKCQIFIYFLLLNVSFQFCTKGENCVKCNYLTNLCIKCSLDIYTPDKNGGCQPSKQCIAGKNYCNECSDNLEMCKECESGYFPDQNGRCTYTDNCELSFKGECLQCKENYILVGKNSYIKNNFILCKSLDSQDLKNCEEINTINGICSKCKEGFYLSQGDNRCTETNNCLESSFGLCIQCIRGYYLNKIDNKCLKQEGNLFRCQQTIDGQTCDICDEGFYLAKDGKCARNNFCEQVGNSGECLKCISGYYNSTYDSICSSTDNCYFADKDTGLCNDCLKDYYLEFKDGKCRTNQEDNEFKYCRDSEEVCIDCFYPYFLTEDSKCASTKNCAESENGNCILCSDNYFLGLDKKCTDVENCIYSDEFYYCIQCIDKYYYDPNDNKCQLEKEGFINCQYAYYNGEICDKCREDFYLNKTDNLCYSNKEFGNFYKCAETDLNGEYCNECNENYYLGLKYKRCSIIDGCEISFEEKKCEECDIYHALNVKNGDCEINYKIVDEDKMYYYKCNRTNEEGNACDICFNGYMLNDDSGLCVDSIHCVEESDGICKKCERKEGDISNYCLNSILGCVETKYPNCLECNDIFNFDKCSKCIDGYKINKNNYCEIIKENNS